MIEADALGRPLKAERVSYRVGRGDAASAEIIEEPTGVVVTYIYSETTTKRAREPKHRKSDHRPRSCAKRSRTHPASQLAETLCYGSPAETLARRHRA